MLPLAGVFYPGEQALPGCLEVLPGFGFGVSDAEVQRGQQLLAFFRLDEPCSTVEPVECLGVLTADLSQP